MSKQIKVSTPEELRSLLLETAVAVLEGRVNCQQANSIVGLSTEVHKSVRMEWDMRVFAAENISIESANVVNTLLEAPDEVKT